MVRIGDSGYPQSNYPESSNKSDQVKKFLDDIEEFLMLMSILHPPKSAGDSSSKEGRIQEVEEKLLRGEISPMEAAIEIMQIIQEEAKKIDLALPTQNPTSSKDQLLAKVALLAVTLTENDHHAAGQAVSLAQDISSGAITENGANSQFQKLKETI